MKENNYEKNKTERKALDMLLEMLAKETNDPTMVFYNEQNKLGAIAHKIGMNMKTVSKEQYIELANIFKQFNKVIDDYLTENNIELKEEN